MRRKRDTVASIFPHIHVDAFRAGSSVRAFGRVSSHCIHPELVWDLHQGVGVACIRVSTVAIAAELSAGGKLAGPCAPATPQSVVDRETMSQDVKSEPSATMPRVCHLAYHHVLAQLAWMPVSIDDCVSVGRPIRRALFFRRGGRLS